MTRTIFVKMRVMGYDSAVPGGEEGSSVSGESGGRVLLWRVWEESIFRGLFKAWRQFL